MKTICLFPLEFGRLLQNRLTWLIVLLTVISPAAGLFLYKPATATTMLSLYLANPAIAGPRPHHHEFSCPLERSASEGIFVRDLMLTEPCPFRAQQHTKHREVSAYAKS